MNDQLGHCLYKRVQ